MPDTSLLLGSGHFLCLFRSASTRVLEGTPPPLELFSIFLENCGHRLLSPSTPAHSACVSQVPNLWPLSGFPGKGTLSPCPQLCRHVNWPQTVPWRRNPPATSCRSPCSWPPGPRHQQLLSVTRPPTTRPFPLHLRSRCPTPSPRSRACPLRCAPALYSVIPGLHCTRLIRHSQAGGLSL